MFFFRLPCHLKKSLFSQFFPFSLARGPCQSSLSCIIPSWLRSPAHDYRVARWFVFKPKIPILGKFWRAQSKRCWYILLTFGIFYGHLGYFMTICYILCSIGTFFLVLVSCANKNLATVNDYRTFSSLWSRRGLRQDRGLFSTKSTVRWLRFKNVCFSLKFTTAMHYKSQATALQFIYVHTPNTWCPGRSKNPRSSVPDVETASPLQGVYKCTHTHMYVFVILLI
jgi:hypothetical protein